MPEPKGRGPVRRKLLKYVAGEVMKKDVITVTPETELSMILEDMRRHDLHEIPVLEGKKLAGVVSYKDIIKRKNLAVETQAGEIMVSPPGLNPEVDSIDLAEAFVASRFRQLPIVSDKKRLLGVVSRRDLVRLIPNIHEFGRIRAKSIMTQDPVTVPEDWDVDRTLAAMRDLKVRTVPVVNAGDNIVGVVGIKDIYAYARPKGKETAGELVGESAPVELPIKSLMVTNAIAVKPDTSLIEVSKLILENNISTIPVIENEKMVGVITKYDLMEYIVSFKEREVLFVQISGLDNVAQSSRDTVFSAVKNSMEKFARVGKPLFCTIRVTCYERDGRSRKYSLHCRLATEKKTYYAKAFNWNLMNALNELLQHLDNQVMGK
jgi:CBS domain-containing protein